MNVKEIVKEYLVKHKYDGLYVPGECACKLDDFVPCDEISMDCKAGYFIKGDPNDGFDFHIGPKK